MAESDDDIPKPVNSGTGSRKSKKGKKGKKGKKAKTGTQAKKKTKARLPAAAMVGPVYPKKADPLETVKRNNGGVAGMIAAGAAAAVAIGAFALTRDTPVLRSNYAFATGILLVGVGLTAVRNRPAALAGSTLTVAALTMAGLTFAKNRKDAGSEEPSEA